MCHSQLLQGMGSSFSVMCISCHTWFYFRCLLTRLPSKWCVSIFDFDSTLGFPGEGPAETSCWSLATVNVGSLKTSTSWKACQSSAVCAQETRVGKNGFQHASKLVQQEGLHLFHGELLPGLLSSHGVTRTPHGGVAILAPRELSVELQPGEDATGLYAKLRKTKRVQACWIQVMKHLRVLVFSVYCKTAASADKHVLDFNDALLSDVFAIASQWGDVPIIVAGDFQLPPIQYPIVAHATSFMHWNDSLQFSSSEDSARPLTFSMDGNFTGYGDGCSSIDGILTNSVATAALSSVEVLPMFRVQHRPVKATFNWGTIWQCGFKLFKPAPFVFPPGFAPQESTPELDFPCHEDIDSKWHFANRVCINTLLDQGASWGPGFRERGTAVRTRPKQICPGQAHNGAATTQRASWLSNALRGLLEMQAFHTQDIQSSTRRFICQRTIVKTWSRLFWLRAPCLWPYERSPTLIEITQAIQWILDTQAVLELKCKLKRIQAWKDKIQDSAKVGSAYLFRHLRNKTSDEPANLIMDQEKNIVFAPNEAIREINQQWDSVYSANAGFPHPLKMLEIVWPQIHHFSHSCSVPDVTAVALRDIIKRRRPDAAPGLDGWRTIEMQSLPVKCFEPFAMLFKELEEGTCPMPQSLATAKQVILNKNGSSEPLQKHLITLLPVILLAYTGARFKHLRDWQLNLMPPQLQGGIPTRQMSAIHTHLALTLDSAKNANDPLIGIKIDKAKCFDRILPQYAGALMLAFGVPQGIVSVFLKLYSQLERHLQFKSWFAPTATHGTNGVAQGCSLSLIAVNVHMKAWIHMLDALPHVTAKAFVDDAYLWARLIHSQELFQAMRITQCWDELVGQTMNSSKCTVWGTTGPARKCIKSLFPQMKLALELEVLGVHVRTSDRVALHFTETKCAKIVADIKNIGALPISAPQKAKIIGCKVMPQCTYNAAINGIPSKMLAKIQGEIVNVLWNKRPHWRSRFLVFAFMSQPHRVEPLCARHYNVILDCYRFLHLFPAEVPRFRYLLSQASPSRFSVAQNLRQAFRFFSLELDTEGMIHFRHQKVVDFLALSVREIKPVLKQLAKQACYAQASLQSRKDFLAPGGIIDYHLSTLFAQKPTFMTEGLTPAVAYFQAQQVGCVLTNDRLAAAKLIDTPECRLCHGHKESLPHLVRDCPVVQHDFPPPAAHELGRNFELLGIVEHPWSILAHRLQVSQVSSVPCPTWLSDQPTKVLWTDGSVLWSKHFALTCAGFAVVDCNQIVTASGPVCHWTISSYTAELWALLYAFLSATGPVEIRSDCKTLVEQISCMCVNHAIQPEWSHPAWWQALFHVWEQRILVAPCPLQAVWIPAHQLEQIPVHLIDEDMARAHGSTVQDITLNREADHAAKRAAGSHAPIFESIYPCITQAVLLRQEWLTRLCLMLGQDVHKEVQETEDERLEETLTPAEQFPQLQWQANPLDFSWQVQHVWPRPLAQWTGSESEWHCFGSFVSLLKWSCAAELKVSYTELAVLFVFLKVPCPLFDDEHLTFQALAKWIKNSFALCRRKLPFDCTPGKHEPHIAHTWGKSMPPGTICGCRPFFSDAALHLLVRVARKVTGAAMSAWNFPIAEFR